MKNSWVSEITEFFEGLSKQNFINSFKKGKNLKMEDIKSAQPDKTNNMENLVDNSSSEHCYTIEEAKYIFENKNLNNNDNCSLSQNKAPLRTISSFDIFSGNVTDHDIPPIEADIEEDGVYPCADIGPIACYSNNGQVNKRIKHMKNNSYSNRRSFFKKSVSGRNFQNGSDVDKENEGVIIRMRNQEFYYDGKDKYQSQLPEGPLYQFYENTRILSKRSIFAQKAHDKSFDDDNSHDMIQNSIIYSDLPLPPVDLNNKIYDRMTRDEDNDSVELEPNIDNDMYPDNRNLQLFSENFQRLRWAETEEGKKLIKMQKLDEDIIKWQEAQFEVITSEASYYRSLEILVNKIYKSAYMDCYKEKRSTYNPEYGNIDPDEVCTPLIKPIISATQKHHLFSNILEIHIVSGELLKALESRWRENPLIKDLSDILYDFCQEKLKPYVTYLRNQRYQTDTYNKLLNLPEFMNIIKHFEGDPDCGMMNLCSFLMLPMQRVLRLKLLMTVIKHHTPKNMSTSGCDAAIDALETLIKECSDGKMVMEQKEEILLICNRLIIKDKTNVSIGSKPLLQKGQIKITSNNTVASKSLGSSFMSRNNNKAQLYLFEDQLIIAKQKKVPLCVSSTDDREVVVDLCPRSDVKFITGPSSPRSLNRSNKVSGSTNFKLVLTSGMKGTAEYSCSTETQDELIDWQNIFCPVKSFRDGFEFNEAFVIRDYTPTSKKEIELKKGQILNIIRLINDDRAIASSGGKQGEIHMSCVQFVSTPRSNLDLMREISFSNNTRKTA